MASGRASASRLSRRERMAKRERDPICDVCGHCHVQGVRCKICGHVGKYIGLPTPHASAAVGAPQLSLPLSGSSPHRQQPAARHFRTSQPLGPHTLAPLHRAWLAAPSLQNLLRLARSPRRPQPSQQRRYSSCASGAAPHTQQDAPHHRGADGC